MSRRLLLLVLIAWVLWAAPASAAITVTEKMVLSTTDNLGGPGGSYVTTAGTWTTNAGATTFAIASGAIGLCFTQHGDTGAAEAISSFSHDGAGWTLITSQVYQTDGLVSAFWIAGSRASSAVTVSMGGADNQTGLIIACYEVAGSDTTTPVIQFTQCTSLAATAHACGAVAALTANSAIFQSVGALSAQTWTPQFTSGTEGAYATPTGEGIVQWGINQSDTTPTWTTASSANVALIVVEIREASSGATAKQLLLLGIGDE